MTAREDRAIQERLGLHHAAMTEYEAAGMTREVASQAAFELIGGLSLAKARQAVLDRFPHRLSS